MTTNAEIKVGPVLSFRGYEARDSGIHWKVSALVGVAQGTPAPTLTCEGNKVPAPMVLADRAGLTLLRYDLTVPLSDQERRIPYAVDGLDARWEFTVPSKTLHVRNSYVSCNGFSDPGAMRKLTHKAGSVWEDILTNHDRTLHPDAPIDKEQLWHLQRGHGEKVQRFHVLLMGGDQVYFDSLWEDIPELKEWADLNREAQITYPVSSALQQRISDYYFNKYCERWLKPARGGWSRDTQERDSADAMARIPTVMMWDDHDIFDGWGSYSPPMQQCQVAQTLFHCAREAFWVFQLQHQLDLLPELKPHANFTAVDAPQYAPVLWSEQLAADPLRLALLDNQPGFSYSVKLGTMPALVLDLRTERSRKQILSEPTWEAMEKWLVAFPSGTDKDKPRANHLLLLSSVPVAHPKLSAAASLLDTFGSEHVVDSNADDLRDHWSHDDHEPERKRLTRLLIKIAQDKRVRISLLSGDVHVAAWGSLYRNDVSPEKNWLSIQQLTSSAVLHPAPSGPIEQLFVKLLNVMAQKVQRIDTQHQCEMMLFPAHHRYVMAARNWLALESDQEDQTEAIGPRLWATWRCEAEQGFSNHLVAIHPAPSLA